MTTRWDRLTESVQQLVPHDEGDDLIGISDISRRENARQARLTAHILEQEVVRDTWVSPVASAVQSPRSSRGGWRSGREVRPFDGLGDFLLGLQTANWRSEGGQLSAKRSVPREESSGSGSDDTDNVRNSNMNAAQRAVKHRVDALLADPIARAALLKRVEDRVQATPAKRRDKVLRNVHLATQPAALAQQQAFDRAAQRHARVQEQRARLTRDEARAKEQALLRRGGDAALLPLGGLPAVFLQRGQRLWLVALALLCRLGTLNQALAHSRTK